MTDNVPIYTDLSFYPNQDVAKQRYDNIISHFQKSFNTKPEFVARAPGRVNLIGDHIDYSYFSSLPMAIETDAVAAVATTDDGKVVLTNLDPKFTQQEFEVPPNKEILTIDTNNFSWASYFKCGFLVAQKFLLEKHPELVKDSFKGLRVTFHGNVPTGGGLSSSAALCVSSTLLVLRANGLREISKKDLTKITVVTEHYVGVNTGGMDQCASIYGEKSKCLLVHYQPQLYGQTFSFPVIKPNNMVILISNSLVESNKLETGPVNYNLRVVEVSSAAEFLAKKVGITLPQDSNLGTGSLRGFIDCYYEQKLNQPKWNGHDIDVGYDRLTKALELVEQLFDESQKVGFTTDEIANQLGLSVDEYTQKFLTKFPVRYTKLKLYQLAKHVYLESLNVLKTLRLLQNYSGEGQDFLTQLGQLINDSQATAKNNCENSAAENDALCEIALQNGSYGSRVTGAGWGGSCIHITTSDKVQNLISQLTDQYYKKKFPSITDEELDQALVVSQPSAGASLVELQI